VSNAASRDASIMVSSAVVDSYASHDALAAVTAVNHRRRQDTHRDEDADDDDSRRRRGGGGGAGGALWRLLTAGAAGEGVRRLERRNVLLGCAVSLVLFVVLLMWRFRPVPEFEPLVDATGVSFPVIIGEYGESCFHACKRHNLQCNVRNFPMINTCDSLRQLFGQVTRIRCSVSMFIILILTPNDRNRTHHVAKSTATICQHSINFSIAYTSPNGNTTRSISVDLQNDIGGAVVSNSPYRVTCGGAHTNTKRACPCVERDDVMVSRSVHVV
jgi:hypothetical protein